MSEQQLKNVYEELRGALSTLRGLSVTGGRGSVMAAATLSDIASAYATMVFTELMEAKAEQLRKRSSEHVSGVGTAQRSDDGLAMLLASNPDLVKKLDPETLTKITLLRAATSGDPASALLAAMLLHAGNGRSGGNNDVLAQAVAKLIEKSIDNKTDMLEAVKTVLELTRQVQGPQVLPSSEIIKHELSNLRELINMLNSNTASRIEEIRADIEKMRIELERWKAEQELKLREKEMLLSHRLKLLELKISYELKKEKLREYRERRRDERIETILETVVKPFTESIARTVSPHIVTNIQRVLKTQSIRVRCPKCGQLLLVKAGSREATCPYCGARFRIAQQSPPQSNPVQSTAQSEQGVKNEQGQGEGK